MKPSFLVFFGHATKLMGSQFPNQRWNPFPLQWKLRVLATGPAYKFLKRQIRWSGIPSWYYNYN